MVREILFVISDLYATAEVAADAASEISLPGLEQTARFADQRQLPGGWRASLLQWFAGAADAQLRFLAQAGLTPAEAQPATIAALGLTEAELQQVRADLAGVPQLACWMATPVHLVTGLTSLHLDRRSVMRLPMREMTALAGDFARVFAGASWRLQPLQSGEFLLMGPRISPKIRNARSESEVSGAFGVEPERLIGRDLAASGLTDQEDVDRLHAEMQMWLHEHPVNQARVAAGKRPVSALWLWGCGPAPRANVAQQSSRVADTAQLAFGDDAFLQGLCANAGTTAGQLPSRLAPVFGYPHAQRAVLVLEIARMLEANAHWSWADALRHIDGEYLQPGLIALRQRKLQRLIVLANDRGYTLRAHQRFRFWRQPRAGLAALT
jgi:hypothetical protein